MTDSAIIHHNGGTSFVGPDAVRLFQATALRSALSLYVKTGLKPNRAWTPTAMLALAGDICGKTYGRNQKQQALDDLTVWIATMKSALPVQNG